VIGLVGHGEVGEEPFELELAVLADDPGQVEGGVGVTAHPVHAGVDLQVHVEGVHHPGVGHGFGQGVDGPAAVDHGGEAPVDDRLGGARRRLGQQQDRRIDTGFAQLDAFLHQRHAEPGGARLEGGEGHCDRAVPVAVRLHDRHEPGRAGPVGEERGVVADGVQIDLRPHGAVVRSGTAAGHARHSTSQCVRRCFRTSSREQRTRECIYEIPGHQPGVTNFWPFSKP
jgi:hypothetical protein